MDRKKNEIPRVRGLALSARGQEEEVVVEVVGEEKEVY
jgi:hypothetical protein